MYRIVTVSAYDVMDKVHIALHLNEWDGPTMGAPSTRLQASFDEQSIGAESDLAWLRHVTGALYDFARRYEDLPREE